MLSKDRCAFNAVAVIFLVGRACLSRAADCLYLAKRPKFSGMVNTAPRLYSFHPLVVESFMLPPCGDPALSGDPSIRICAKGMLEEHFQLLNALEIFVLLRVLGRLI